MAGRTHEIPLPLGRPRPLTPRVSVPKPSELRKWAIEHGFEVGEKGRIPEAVEVAYCQEQLIDLRSS
jgi:hypothetical protein